MLKFKRTQQFSGSPETGLDVAILHHGTIAALAEVLGVTRGSIQSWRKNGVPVERIPSIVAACHGKVTAEQLRPDVAKIFEKEAARA